MKKGKRKRGMNKISLYWGCFSIMFVAFIAFRHDYFRLCFEPNISYSTVLLAISSSIRPEALRDFLLYLAPFAIYAAVIAVATYPLTRILKGVKERIRPTVPHAQKIFRPDEAPKKGDYWGFVYVLENRSMPGILKIGYTSKNPFERAKELSSTGVATPFKVLHAIESQYAKKVERQVHRLLNDCRINKNREFFRCDLTRAIAIIQTAERHVKQAAKQR